ncbi:MAG TPA: hypothetical protein VI358_00280 [Pseudolabrys sp.]
MVTVIDEVTRALGDVRSAAGKVFEASETVEAGAKSLSVELQVFMAAPLSDVAPY